MDNTNYYAKSKPKILLTEHSKNVSEVGLCILNKTLSQFNQNLEDIVKYSGLFHDIAKIPHILQMKILGYPLPENEKNKYRHNEIGWAFLYRYLNVPKEILILVSETVYWSHGISNFMHNDTIDSILDSISDTDIENMKSYVKSILGNDYILDTPRDLNYDQSVLTPFYYLTVNEDSFTEKSIIARTSLISADRLVSKLELTKNLNEVDISLELDKLINKENNFSLLCPKHYNEERFEFQKKIAELSINGTTIVNAVAGFGKSNVGLLWSSPSPKKLLWLCPTNTVGDSVFDILVKTANDYGSKIKIQLYLTNKIVNANYPFDENTEPFDADIIVTNIDSYLNPTIQSRHADRLFLINNADVIIDEFHELNTNTPLMAAFINIMRVRHRMTDSRTLLLSATGIKMSYLWDSIERKTQFLPSEYEHYDAPHNSLITLRVIEGNPETKGNDELIIFNSKANTQKQYYKNKSKKIIHSDYIEEEKRRKVKDLIDTYGKEDIYTEGKDSVTGSPLVQNSLDVSFAHVYDSNCSPEKSLQSNGRNDRHGNIITECTHTIFKPTDISIKKSEDAAIKIVYDIDLSDLWYYFILKYDGKQITKNEFYILYNKHSENIKKEIRKFINNNYIKSVKGLSTVYPKHYNPSSNIILPNANSNKLRSDGSEIYFIVKNRITNQYTDPFTTPIYRSFADDFNDDGDIYKLIPIYKELVNDPRFDFGKILKNKKYQTIDKIRMLANRERTPYILLDRVYDPEYGIIKKSNLKSVGLQ